MKIILTILTGFALISCLPEPYKMDVPQGNILTKEQISQLTLGMSQEAVLNLLGSPSVQDAFHQHRWDYINYSTLTTTKNTHYHITLIFDDEQKLIKIDQKNTSQIHTIDKTLEQDKSTTISE